MDKMKKILLLALLLMPLRTLAENYGITVAGVEVTSENATNVKGEDITAGTVSFDAQSETLTLNNVHANGQIIVTRSSMTINLVGASIFNVNTDNGQTYLIKYGGQIIYGTNQTYSTLTFKADELGAVIHGIGTTNDYKLDPVETNYFAMQYDMSGAWSLTYTNINNLCFCEISKPYLWVNTERVTDANKDEQPFPEATVDLANNEVTLNNLILDDASSSWNFLIKSNLANLNVNITGGLNAFSLYAKNNEVTGNVFVYTGASGETSSLNLSIDQGSALRVTSSGQTPSADWLVSGFTTNNIATDANNAVEGQPIAKLGTPYADQVTLVPYVTPTNYDLIVNGVQVNSDNAYDILGETASGTVSYYASTNTLTLNGVYVRCESDFLDFSTEGLTVYLIGDNTIYSPSNDAVVFNSTVSDNTITFTTSTSNPGLLQIQSLNPFANVTPFYENGLIYDGSTDAKDIKPIKVPVIYADTSYEEDILTYSLNISISDSDNPTGTKYFYTIDYADASLSDVTTFTQAVYNDGNDAVDPIPLLGPCTVTVYAKYGETQSANVVGKLFGFASNTVTSQVGQTIEAPQVIPALDNDMTVNISPSPNETDFVNEDENGGYIAKAAGSVVFSGNLQMGTTYPDYDVLNSDGMLGDFTVNILQDPQLIFYSEEALGEVTYCEAYMGQTFQAPELRYQAEGVLTVTYQSSNEQVASVNSQTGQVTLVGIGDVTITATSEATDDYASGTAEYTLRVGRALDLRFDTNQWVTYFSDEDLTIPNGVASYIVTGVNGNTVTVETTRYIPAGVGVLLKQDGDSYADQFVAWAFTGSTAEFNYAANNLLRGVSTASVPSELGPIYVLYNDEFVRLKAGTSVAANHCYLPLSLPASARLSIVFDDDVPTAISAISTSGADMAEGAWYTIDGRRLSGKPVKAGLYIQNGKKVSIK